MRPVRARRRVLSALAKTKALGAIESGSRLEEHALGEAVLHQMHATWIALVRQVGDAHGLAPESIDSLTSLNERLLERGLPSAETETLLRLVADTDDWLDAFFKHYASVCCPAEESNRAYENAIPLQDTTRLEQIIATRYAPWIQSLEALVHEFQSHFDES